MLSMLILIYHTIPNDTQYDILNPTLSITTLFVIMLSVDMQNVVMLSVVGLNRVTEFRVLLC